MHVRRGLSKLVSGFAASGLLLAVAGASPPAEVRAEQPFAGLMGTWSGSGQVQLLNGSTETLKCRAYYTPRESGNSLGLAIRCASPSNKIELRANLTFQGGRISGSWEERTYNATGAVTGQVTGNRFSLSIVGGGFQGSMSVSTSGSNQSVMITTQGIGLKGVNISLSKG